jgi:hypothetical protein
MNITQTFDFYNLLKFNYDNFTVDAFRQILAEIVFRLDTH